MAATGTKTTVKLATLTAAAKNDAFSGTEDSILGVNLNVLANDPGSASLYSVWQPIAEPAGTTPATSGQLPIETSATLPSGAVITMNGDGTVNYNAGNAFQHLGEGDTTTDTFSYTVRMANGALSTATVTLTIQGVNDPATISGNNAVTITEDGVLSASGSLLVSDVDDGEAGFQPVDPNQLTGAYGSFTFNDGAWTFDADNSAAQHLGAGDSATQSLTVTSIDGTATETITVTIEGVNDPAAISGGSTGTVTEDGTLSASGSLSVSDADDDEAGFQPVDSNALNGAYGAFTFNDGTWTFDADNSAAQHLGAGDSATQSLTVTSIDGTATETITVTIEGINDPAAISGGSTGTVTEDGTLSASGSLSVSDADDDETGFQTVNAGDLVGTYGDFTFDASTGAWSYNLRNGDSNVQSLNANDPVVYDTLTVKSLDGSAEQEISVAINGADDVIIGDNLGFEMGDFTSWQTLGVAYIQSGSAPEGNFHASLNSDSGNWNDDIEAFLGVNSAAIDGITNGNPTNGSAIKTTLALNAGDTVSFDWLFATSDYVPYYDNSFFLTLNGSLQQLADVGIVGSFGNSGWQTQSFTVSTSGIYDIGFGVVNEGDWGVNSVLSIDDVEIIETNLGFEHGNFTGWQTIGSTSIGAGGAPDGDFYAALNSDSGNWNDDIEAFLGVNSAAIDGITNGNPTNGSAIKTTLALNAGDTVSFDWLFATSDYVPYYDNSFFLTLNGSLQQLADVGIVGSYGNSGWQTHSFTVGVTGVYDIGFGVVNEGDSGVNSTLLIDHLNIL